MRICCFVLAATLSCLAVASSPQPPRNAAGPKHLKVRVEGKTFDLAAPDGLRRLIAALDHEIQRSADGQADDHSEPGDSVDAEEREALVEMRSLAVDAMENPDRRSEAIFQIREIGRALILKTKYPLPKRVDVILAPFFYYDLMHNPVGIGRTAACNLPSPATQAEDPSLLDPLTSTFWSRPSDIPSRDLYYEFGPPLTLGDTPCTYDSPKTSYGTSPGFSIECGENIIKVKFGESENSKRNAEVAVSRIFGALGYHVEPNNYAPEIRVRYDRRILLEFNSRKPLTTRLTLLGFIPVHAIKIQTVEDPFRYIRSAVKKDGEILSAEALEGRLIRPDIIEKAKRQDKKFAPGSSPEHYREDADDVEQGLDYLVMEEANIQLRGSGGQNVGPWDWNDTDHRAKRELRGAGLLAAWTNYFDARWDNNRLKLIDSNGERGARHFISDLGGSLGRAENFKVDAQGLVNEFPWTFTEGPVLDEDGKVVKPFRIVAYQPIQENRAFRDMTLDDARWMARLIAQVTENQLKQALIATGYTSAEVKLYAEKLISRRDAMIRDLGLDSEIRLLRPNGVDRLFSYDPRTDGPVTALTGEGSELHPSESRDQVVRLGRVVPR